MNFFRLFSLVLVLSAFLIAGCGTQKDVSTMTDAEFDAYAAKVHETVFAIDTHVDINSDNFTPEKNYSTLQDVKVDIVKMEQGGLDGVFFVVYTGQGENTPEGFAAAYANAMDKFEAITALAKDYAPDRVGLALTVAEARSIYASGKKIIFLCVENGYQIGTDIANVQKFYDLGARYMSLSHNGHSQLCDSNTGEGDDIWLHNGLSDLGREVIVEMNRLGMMIDISHPSKQSNLQTMELSKAPVIASHSSARALCDHSRNLDDELLLALKKNGGVMQAVALGSYVKETSEEKRAAQTDVYKEFDLSESRRERYPALEAMDATTKTSYDAKMAAIEAEWPSANVKDYVDHIDYVVEKIGIEHVGISSDFDGGGGITGWNDASESMNVTKELLKRGYTEDQIAMIWGGNLLRVMEECERVAAEIQAGTTN